MRRRFPVHGRRRVSVFGALSFALIARSPLARADEDAATVAARPGFVVEGSGSCPSAGAVADALAVLLPGGTEPAARIRVTDEGPRYRVEVDGQTREYLDEPRGCAERARVSAIFAALTLRPPQLAWPEPAESAPTIPPSSPWTMGVALAVDLAPTTTDVPAAFGGSAFASIGRSLFATLAVGARSAARLPLEGGGTALVTRVPVDLGLGVRRVPTSASGVVLAAELGARASWLLFRGDGLDEAARQSRLDVGARVAARVGLLVGRNAVPFLGLEAAASPRPYTLVVAGRGAVADAPALWIGATMGIEFASDGVLGRTRR